MLTPGVSIPMIKTTTQNFGGRKLWRLGEAKSIQYLSSRDLTTFGGTLADW